MGAVTSGISVNNSAAILEHDYTNNTADNHNSQVNYDDKACCENYDDDNNYCATNYNYIINHYDNIFNNHHDIDDNHDGATNYNNGSTGLFGTGRHDNNNNNNNNNYDNDDYRSNCVECANVGYWHFW